MQVGFLSRMVTAFFKLDKSLELMNGILVCLFSEGHYLLQYKHLAGGAYTDGICRSVFSFNDATIKDAHTFPCFSVKSAFTSSFAFSINVES